MAPQDPLTKRPQAQSTGPDGTTTTTTAGGGVVHSADPSVDPHASAAQKLKGDAAGALSGIAGSAQAAAGAAIRNDAMHDKGLAKMRAEDDRLAAKRGVPPVGATTRGGEAASSEAAVAAKAKAEGEGKETK
ncbi:hypothetical protein GGR56DRAFT_646246 [Xylariaceae sp. FL0804]|nr:hypothetical protein GGR56DRAFT_646246 [Xylariaceae sp. FL0804]